MKNEEGDDLEAVWGHGAEGEGGWRTGAGVGKMMLMGRKKLTVKSPNTFPN